MAQVEQAIFTSARTDSSAGYQLVGRSPGVCEADARHLAAWGPSHDALLEVGPEAVSINFHPLPSGAYCVSRTSAAGWEYSGRGGRRVYTQCLIVPPHVLERFANNPFAVVRAAVASGAMHVFDHVPYRLDPISLLGTALPVDQELLAMLAAHPGPQALAALVQAARDAECLAVASPVPTDRLFAGLIGCLPPECRRKFSFSTGLRFSSRRRFRLVALSGDRSEQLWVAHQSKVTLLDLADSQALESLPLDGWSQWIRRVLAGRRISFLARQLSKRRFDLALEDLPALGLQLLEQLEAAELHSEDGSKPPRDGRTAQTHVDLRTAGQGDFSAEHAEEEFTAEHWQAWFVAEQSQEDVAAECGQEEFAAAQTASYPPAVHADHPANSEPFWPDELPGEGFVDRPLLPPLGDSRPVEDHCFELGIPPDAMALIENGSAQSPRRNSTRCAQPAADSLPGWEADCACDTRTAAPKQPAAHAQPAAAPEQSVAGPAGLPAEANRDRAVDNGSDFSYPSNNRDEGAELPCAEAARAAVPTVNKPAGKGQRPAAGQRRAHAAHRPAAGTAAAGEVARPSAQLAPDSPEVLARLEQLDDVVYEALDGQATALEELEQLWPEVLAELGEELVAESREQYLRYALQIWERSLGPDGLRKPGRAAQALDVLCVLFGEF